MHLQSTNCGANMMDFEPQTKEESKILHKNSYFVANNLPEPSNLLLALPFKHLVMLRSITFNFIFLTTCNHLGAQEIKKYDYLQLRGTISTYPVTLRIEAEEKGYTGYYQYDKVRTPIPLAGAAKSSNTEISLHAKDNKTSELFDIRMREGAFEGTWKKDIRSKPLPVLLQEIPQATAFDIWVLEDSLKLLPAIENSPMANYNARILWPSGSSPTDAFIKRLIAEQLFKMPTSTDVQIMLKQSRDDYFESYRNTFADEKETEILENPFFRNSNNDLGCSVNSETKRLICLQFVFYEYSGGAHGITGISFINADKLEKKVIKIEDVLLNPGSLQLLRILESRFRIQSGAPPGRKLSELGLFEDRIMKLSDNFYIEEKGIGFFYNQYEIAPYAAGPIDIFVPYSDLKGHLKAEFQRMIK